MRRDNEKDALLYSKVMIDIVPHQTNVLRDKFQTSLALIQHMFDQIQLMVIVPGDFMPGILPPGSSHTHERPDSSVASISDIGLGIQLQETLTLLQTMASLKEVLAECPIIAESGIQVLVSMNIKRFFLFIESVLLLQEQDHAAGAVEGTIFTKVNLNISNRPEFKEFIRTQVEAIITFASMFRYCKKQELECTEFENFLPTLPPIIIRLLKDCPREMSGVRKKLLIAIRYFINFCSREIFVEYINELLEELTLIGDGLTTHELDRPLAYSILADLIHHVRDTLEPPQIRKTVEVYAKNLQDNFPGTCFQTMSARLLFSMAEYIAKMPEKVDARHYLIMILNAIGDKFAELHRQYPNAVKLSKLYTQQPVDGSPDNYLADKDHLGWDEIGIFTATPIKTWDRRADPVADIKILFKELIKGLTKIFHQLKACQLAPSIRFTAEEIQVLVKLFREGAYVFRYYYETDESVTEPNALELVFERCTTSSTKEEKDLLKAFVALLEMDPTTSHGIFHDEIEGALRRFPKLSEIFPRLVEQHRSKYPPKVKERSNSIFVVDITDQSFLSVIDTALDKICEIQLSYEYLNRFPQEVRSLVFAKIEEQKYGQFFAQILEHLDSGPLREAVDVERLIKISKDMDVMNDARQTIMINSILIMHSLCKSGGDIEWMENKQIAIWLKMVGKNLEAHLRTNTLPPHLRLAAEQASEQLMVVFVKFLEYHPADFDALLSLIDSVTNEDFRFTQPLLKHIYHRIICSNSIEFRKTIVLQSLEVYASKGVSQKIKTFLLHYIVNPIIIAMHPSKQTSTKSPRLIDKAVIESIRTKIWKVSLSDDLTQPGVDHTRMEVLRLTATLVKDHHSVLLDSSQDIIKFCLTRFEDIVCKYAAYVVIGYCTAHFETPTETIRQVYTSLLGSSYEVRALVTQALELIAPNLCDAAPNDRNPFWVAIPCTILERKDAQQTTTVFRFLVKHADLFYEYRDSFIKHVVKWLSTIAQTSDESKQLVIKLRTLVLRWEQRQIQSNLDSRRND